MRLLFPGIKLSRKTFKITIGVEHLSFNYYPNLVSFGELTIGNDDPEDEMILFPGSFKLKFHISSDKFEDVLAWLYSRDMSGKTARIVVEDITTSGSMTVFAGHVVTQSIQSNITDSTFTATFFDDYQTLKVPNILNPEGQSKHNLIEHIKLLFPTVQTVDVRTELLYVVRSGTSIWQAGLTELGSYNIVLGNNQYYKTNGDLFKSLLNNFASRAVVIGRKLIIIPRYYNSSPIKFIHRSLICEKPRVTLTEKKEGMRIWTQIGATDVPQIWGNVETDSTNKKINNAIEFRIPLSLNDPSLTDPPYDVKALYYYTGMTAANPCIDINSARIKLSNGTYSNSHSIVFLCGSVIWNNISRALRKVEIELLGTDYDITDFMQIDGMPGTYRCIKMVQNFKNNKSKLILLESATI